MLYSCGVFINRCYDELNVTEPDLVRSVHEQYLLAGAELIETNTFGANAVRLEHFGLRDRVAGLQPRRRSVGSAVCERPSRKAGLPTPLSLARSGSLGHDAQPRRHSGRAGRSRPRNNAFAEQIAALRDAGADLLLFETMMSLGGGGDRPARRAGCGAGTEARHFDDGRC